MKKLIFIVLIIFFLHCFISPRVNAENLDQYLLQTPIFSLHSQGIGVRKIQEQLQKLGYYQGQIDGFYGEKTQIAVNKFQKEKGLNTDGIIGLKTWEYLSENEPNNQVNSNSLMPPDIAKILAKEELVIAMLGVDNPPFFMTDKNICQEKKSQEKIQEKSDILCGLDVEIGKKIAESLGVKVRFDRSQKKFNDVVNLVYEKKADLAISKLSISLKRAQKINFSEPYVRMREGLLVNRLELAKNEKNNNTIEVIRNLKGKIGVIQGTQYLLFAKQRFPQATIVEYPSWEEIIKAVIKGEIMAGYRDEMEVKKIVLTQPNVALNVKTVALTDTKDSLAVITSWDNTHLLKFINQVLDKEIFNYSVNDIISKYPEVFKPN